MFVLRNSLQINESQTQHNSEHQKQNSKQLLKYTKTKFI